MEIIKFCVACWNSYKEYVRKKHPISTKNDFINWLNDKEYGFLKIKKMVQSIFPYEFQINTIKKIYEQSQTSSKVLVLKAPTSAGKTEIPFAAFLNQIYEKKFEIAPRLIYTLPINTLARITKERAIMYLLATLIFKDDDNVKVKEFIEKWSYNNTFKPPIGFETGSLIKEAGFLYDGFITVGTIDSIIYSFVSQRVPGGFKSPRLNLPAGLLASSLFVLDEVQMLQDKYYYSPRVLNIILRQLYSVHAPILFMTATLPKKLKETLFEGIDYEEITFDIINRGNVKVNIIDKNIKDSIFESEIIKKIKETINEKMKHVLIVVNKVETAKDIYRNLINSEFKDKLILIHGQLNVEDRENAEKKLQEEKGLIVVSTQVIESGYDFDAGLLITELSPIDSLIQRIGRIARKQGDEGEAYITIIDNAHPYITDLIEKTKEVIKGKEDILEEAIKNIKKTEELLDEVYTEDLKNKLIEGISIQEETQQTKKNRASKKKKQQAEKMLANTLSYIRKLRLLSLPPEDVEFNFRPELYVTVITTDNDILSKITPNKPLEWDDYNKLIEEMHSKSLNISLITAKNLQKYVQSKFSKKRIKDKFIINLKDDVDKIYPLEILLLKPKAYEQKLGLKLE